LSLLEGAVRDPTIRRLKTSETNAVNAIPTNSART